LRDRWADYLATGAEVVGISSDSIESHKKFADHHDLPLRLLSDSDGAVSRLYGARSLIPGRVARSVFVIDAKGMLRYSEVRPIGLFKPKDDDNIAAIRAAQGASIRSVSQRARTAHRSRDLPALLERMAAKTDADHQSLRPGPHQPG